MSLDPDIEFALGILRDAGVLIELSAETNVATEDVREHRAVAHTENSLEIMGRLKTVFSHREAEIGHHTRITSFLSLVDVNKIREASCASDPGSTNISAPVPAVADSSASPASSPTPDAGAAPTPNGSADA